MRHPLSRLSFQQRGWITLASGFALHFCLGTFYLWGSIATYTASYLHNKGVETSKEEVGAVFPFTFFAMNIGNATGVRLPEYIGYNRFLFGVGILIGLTVLLSSYLLYNLYLFALTYGVIFGFLCGISYMAPFSTCFL